MKVDRGVLSRSAALLVLCVGWTVVGAAPAEAAKKPKPRSITIEDYFEIGSVGEARISPDGRWIAYSVGTSDLEADDSASQIWMVPAQGGDAIPLSTEGESTSSPRWSPDGKYLGFLSARGEGKDQVWTLFREGGEAVQLTDTAQDVKSFEWSPDGKRMLLVLRDPKPAELEAKQAEEKGEAYEEKTPPPFVITRRQFKRDYVGYLDNRRTHVYVFDVATKELRQVTFGDFDDSEPAWSPDGSRIAFVSNRTEDPDTNYNTDIWVVSAAKSKRKAALVRITTNEGPDATPSWSVDGKRIAHTANLETDTSLYATNHLAVSSAAGGGLKVLTQQLDRMIYAPRFSRHDDSIYFLLEDSGEQNLARMAASGGDIERLVAGPRSVREFHQGPANEIATVVSEPHFPPEVFLYANGGHERRSHVNDALIAELKLGSVEEVRFASKDGTEIEAFVVKPPGFSKRRRYPAILRIHGGPQAQYDFSFSHEAQLWAANGYVVVMPNPRGSTGYGRDFCMAIWQNWAGVAYEDVMASVDFIVNEGWADPDRLAVTGWSYGGILTNHVITSTERFKVAVTGASEFLYVVNFGHDHYQRWWLAELGPPWKPEARDLYDRMSPFKDVEKIVTPTLIVGGAIDWNVPIINSEQLYLALKILGVPTELVVYPDEHHGIATPTYVQDLYQRYLDWFAKYMD